MNKRALIIGTAIILTLAFFPNPDSLAQDPPPRPPIHLPIIEVHTPPGIYLLISTHTHYVAYGSLHVVGEIFNHTSGIIRFGKVYIDIFDDNDQLLDTDFTYTHLDDIQPETKACFNLSLPEPPGWSYYNLYSSYHKGGDPLPNLTVFSDSGLHQPDNKYKVLGLVRNDHGVRVDFVQPIITLYDVSGNVIDCNFTFVNDLDLEPGQSMAFEKTFSYRDYSVVTSYQIQADGNPQ